MRRCMFVALLMVSVAAQAMSSLRVGDKVLSVGDTAARVLPYYIREILPRADVAAALDALHVAVADDPLRWVALHVRPLREVLAIE